jgi:hypothetical protein
VGNSSTRERNYAIQSMAKSCYADPLEQLSEEEGIQQDERGSACARFLIGHVRRVV